MHLTREDKETLIDAIEILAKVFAPPKPERLYGAACVPKPEKIIIQQQIKSEEANNKRQDRARLIPLTKWNEYHDYPPPGGLRHLVFFSKTNGFDSVIRRIGRRVLIDEAAFFHWVEEQNKGN